MGFGFEIVFRRCFGGGIASEFHWYAVFDLFPVNPCVAEIVVMYGRTYGCLFELVNVGGFFRAVEPAYLCELGGVFRHFEVNSFYHRALKFEVGRVGGVVGAQ